MNFAGANDAAVALRRARKAANTRAIWAAMTPSEKALSLQRWRDRYRLRQEATSHSFSLPGASSSIPSTESLSSLGAVSLAAPYLFATTSDNLQPLFPSQVAAVARVLQSHVDREVLHMFGRSFHCRLDADGSQLAINAGCLFFLWFDFFSFHTFCCLKVFNSSNREFQTASELWECLIKMADSYTTLGATALASYIIKDLFQSEYADVSDLLAKLFVKEDAIFKGQIGKPVCFVITSMDIIKEESTTLADTHKQIPKDIDLKIIWIPIGDTSVALQGTEQKQSFKKVASGRLQMMTYMEMFAVLYSCISYIQEKSSNDITHTPFSFLPSPHRQPLSHFESEERRPLRFIPALQNLLLELSVVILLLRLAGA